MMAHFQNSLSAAALSAQGRIQSELLQVVLRENGNYPWNPANPETTGFFERLEDADDTEQADSGRTQWRQLSHRVRTLWD